MNVSKYMKGFKVSFTFISLGFLLAVTGVAAIANAQAPAQSAGQGPTSGAEESNGSLADQPTSTRPGGPVREREVQQLQQPPRGQATERRAALQARAQERITNLAANMSNRMDAAIARMQNVSRRLSSRIEKLENLGVDTAAAETALENAVSELDAATDTLAGIDTAVAGMVGSETPREGWLRLKETFTSARDSILLAHQGLRNTVATLKAAVAAAERGNGVSEAVNRADSATSSATSSDTN